MLSSMASSIALAASLFLVPPNEARILKMLQQVHDLLEECDRLQENGRRLITRTDRHLQWMDKQIKMQGAYIEELRREIENGGAAQPNRKSEKK